MSDALITPGIAEIPDHTVSPELQLIPGLTEDPISPQDNVVLFEGKPYEITHVEGPAHRRAIGQLGAAAMKQETDRASAEEVLSGEKQLARTDELTDLPNRLALRERLDAVTGSAEPSRKDIVFIDLEGMKAVNDLSEDGHSTGDKLLIAVARTLKQISRKNDFACRVGGDEFIVVKDGEAEGEEYVTSFKERFHLQLIEEIAKFKELIESNRTFGASVGIANWDPKTQNPDEILQEADRRMYRDKQEARGAISK